ncbi:uncharacterized protein LOC130736291 [Lotus japonicus]|uniref:uncharacterized protein LOC130736291 n=1 Tax=Lotus japonicus TaxID=34305 RepID=UPI002582DAD1|nr:uncharacterized protein LOC130736291 [Lotus japonicus]
MEDIGKSCSFMVYKALNGCKIAHAVELALMDSKGAKIQATIRKTLVYKFQHLIKERGVDSISFLAPVVNNGDYKTTKHQYKVNFLYNTEVHPMNQNPINFSPFLFVPICSILNHAIDMFLEVLLELGMKSLVRVIMIVLR